MKCLLDTHILLWWIEDDPKLRADLRATIADPANEVFVSAATLWEAAIKRALGKLRFETPVLLAALDQGGIDVLPITADHALAAGDLPRQHDDPFDRMLVAQAIARGLTLITRDTWLRAYPVAVIEA
ncbi:MAG TPA: type II toxin-antitoxin system VapC family toxin [Geminicoccaceae bacterium]|nr:type II toxin-antitoxin system VapC family toxin [Geminicoccaceae bacterium]